LFTGTPTKPRGIRFQATWGLKGVKKRGEPGENNAGQKVGDTAKLRGGVWVVELITQRDVACLEDHGKRKTRRERISPRPSTRGR